MIQKNKSLRKQTHTSGKGLGDQKKFLFQTFLINIYSSHLSNSVKLKLIRITEWKNTPGRYSRIVTNYSRITANTMAF